MEEVGLTVVITVSSNMKNDLIEFIFVLILLLAVAIVAGLIGYEFYQLYVTSEIINSCITKVDDTMRIASTFCGKFLN